MDRALRKGGSGADRGKKSGSELQTESRTFSRIPAFTVHCFSATYTALQFRSGTFPASKCDLVSSRCIQSGKQFSCLIDCTYVKIDIVNALNSFVIDVAAGFQCVDYQDMHNVN